MSEAGWPSSSEVHAAVGERVLLLLETCGGLVAEVGRRALATGHAVLSEQPHSLTSVVVAGACVAAGGNWRMSLWPAAGAECMMAAADLFDDAADRDPSADEDSRATPAVVLTAAAGLLSLANAAVVRVVEDGASPLTASALARLLGEGFAEAANGQARNLEPGRSQVDALTAYRQAAAKSGPLGALIAQLGARTASDDLLVIDLLAAFGRHLAVRSQLLNDARDAAPDPSTLKADVRAGARTVPLAFAGSGGAPAGLTEAELEAWEQQERRRIAAAGGLIAAQALAEAERLNASQALDRLEREAHPVTGLRQLL
jgi:geranylgeranyl pyrophosphate synthase